MRVRVFRPADVSTMRVTMLRPSHDEDLLGTNCDSWIAVL